MTRPTTMDEALPDDEAASPAVPEETTRIHLTVPLFLAAGWGALIAFSAMFLVDEARVDTAKAATARAAVIEPATFDGTGEPVRAGGATPVALRWDEQEPSVPSREPTRPPAAPGAPRTVAAVAPSPSPSPSPSPAPSPVARSENAVVERADYAGTWGPTSAACASRSRRRGYLPAVITEDGAKAGRTQCRFRNGHRDGVAWTTTADCTDRGRRWTSQVRLVVDGDRLTWTSGKGPAFYVRCGRRDG